MVVGTFQRSTQVERSPTVENLDDTHKHKYYLREPPTAGGGRLTSLYRP